MLHLEVHTENSDRRFDTLALAAKDLDPVLRKFGGYLRKKAVARYKAQDFAPLAESTIDHRAQRGLRALEGKLTREAKRAVERAGKGGGLAAMLAVASRGSKNRFAVLAEFQRAHRRAGRSLQAQAAGTALTLKQQTSLAKRTVRAVEKAVNRPILGKLASTLVVEVDSGTVTLASRTKEKWTEVHNKGGTAGHGAKEPKRETIRIDDEDLDVLGAMLKEHGLLAFESAVPSTEA